MPARAWQMSDSGTEAETRVRQFGEEKCEQRTDDAFVGRVTYPYTGIEELDAALTAWVGSAFDRFIAESVNEGEQTPPAELTIDYDSYVAGGLASVKLSGTYSGADTVHIVAAFNADINGALNILKKGKPDSIDIISILRNIGQTVPIRQKIKL